MVEKIFPRAFQNNFLSAFHQKKGEAILSYIQQFAKKSDSNPIPCPPITSVAFQGGGVKGAAYVGVVDSFVKHQLLPELKAVAGSSVGALTALFLCLGFDEKQFQKISDMNFQDLLDLREGFLESGILGHSPSFSNILKLIDILGKGYVFKGKSLHRLAKMLVGAVLGDENATFLDLSKKIESNTDPLLKHLFVTGTTADNKAVNISLKTYPNVRLADAVIASASFPGVFRKKKVKNNKGDVEFTAKDGGALDNFPINLLDEGVTHTKNYPISFEAAEGQNYPVNKEVLGVTLNSLHDVSENIAPVPEYILEKQKMTSRKILRQSFYGSGLKKLSSWFKTWPVVEFWEVWKASKEGAKAPENVARECSLHAGKIIQIDNCGVGTMDFISVENKREELVRNGFEASNIVLQDVLSPLKAYPNPTDPDDPARFRDLVEDYAVEKLPEYLLGVVRELEKYNLNLDNYKLSELQENVRLQYLSKMISEIVAKNPGVGGEKTCLTDAVEKAKTQYDLHKQLVAKQRKRREAILDDQTVLSQLAGYAKAHDLKEFEKLFRAKLAKTLALAKMPVGQYGSLLEAVIKMGDKEIFESMMGILKNNMVLLNQQGRPPKYPNNKSEKAGNEKGKNEKGDLVPCYDLDSYLNNRHNFKRSPLLAAIDARKLDFLQVLLKKGCSPLCEGENGKTALHYAIESNYYDAFKVLYTFQPIGFGERFASQEGDTLMHTMLKHNMLFGLHALEDFDLWDECVDWDIKNDEAVSCRALAAQKKMTKAFHIQEREGFFTTLFSAAEHFLDPARTRYALR